MSDKPTPTPASSRTRLGRKLLEVVERRALARRTEAGGPAPDAVERASMALVRRAHGVMDRLDGVAMTLERAAAVELNVAERLVPIVEDLGELVRLTLNEARQRRGLAPKEAASSQDAYDEFIDVAVEVSPNPASADVERRSE